MEESDSEREDDPPARATDVPYPLEGKYIDEADKRKIMGMSQLDREEILYADLDLAAVQAQRRMFDPVGHYARPDVFTLHVDTRAKSAVVFDG